MNKWIRLDARGNKENVHAEFCLDEERLAFPIRSELGEVDYRDNNQDLDDRLSKDIYLVFFCRKRLERNE